MPRAAREKKLFSTYQITQSCPDLKIFSKKKNRLLFIEALMKAKEKFDFKLYGLAMNSKGYEMILYDNGSDISKIMRSINISFTMKFKCENENCEHLFKERYKSTILEPYEIQSNINALDLCVYADEILIDTYLLNDTEAKDCIDCREKAKKKLLELIEAEGHTYESMLKDKTFRNQLIKDFRKTSVLNLKELGELFGGISESGISRILSR
jgi:DNA-directed RNA polymerase specialized sigma subunit